MVLSEFVTKDEIIVQLKQIIYPDDRSKINWDRIYSLGYVEDDFLVFRVTDWIIYLDKYTARFVDEQPIQTREGI